MIPQANSVIEVTEPNGRVVISDGPILLKSQATIDSLVVSISFVVVPESSGQMGRDEADACIGKVKSNGTASFVAGDSGKTGLSIC